MRAAAIALVAVVVVIVGWWLWHYDVDPVAKRATAGSAIASGTALGPASGSTVAPAAGPRLTHLTPEERQRAVARIDEARKHHAAGAPPKLPEGSAAEEDTMATAQQVLVQLQQVTDQIRDDVVACSKLAPAVKAFKTQILLTGDPDVGTLIDAPNAGVSDDGTPLPAKFDDCVRSHLQLLELPPMVTNMQFSADFAITL